MAKTLLMPTDFTIRSLHILRHAINNNTGQSLKILFVTGFNLKDSIVEQLFFSRQSTIDTLVGDSFKQACQIIQNKYASQIVTIRFELYTGYTQAAFGNFLTARGVDELYISENTLQFPEKCFDPSPYLRGSVLPKVFVSWDEAQKLTHENQVIELFTSWT